MAKTVVLPTNPVDQKAIADAVTEGCDCLLRMSAEREQLKEIIDMVKEKYELPPKFIRKMITTKHKASFDKDMQESDDFEELYTTIVK